MSLEKDRIFFKNFSIVVIILALMMVVFLIAAIKVGGVIEYGDPDAREQRVSERTAPVGDVRRDGDPMPESTAGVGEESVAAAETDDSDAHPGRSVYEGVCISCHSGAIPNIPAPGDDAAWAPRIDDRGMEGLYANAINGYQGEESGMMMPAKGGNTALSDDEVKAAVDYMVESD